MQTFLRKNKSENLIVFLNGWGMDERPLSPVKSSSDVLFLSDYSDLDFEFDFSKYKKFCLITFSAGVFMAGYLKDKLPNFDLKISVNGVLKPYDKICGIPDSSFMEMEQVTKENALDFRKNFIQDKKHYDLFNKKQPRRSLESSMQELSMLKEYFETPQVYDYDKMIIGINDNVIPYENQLRAWKNPYSIKTVNGGHFLFYEFETFEDIINF